MNTPTSLTRTLLVSFISGCLATTSLFAIDRFWSGQDGSEGGDYNWTNGANWVGGVAPTNHDYTDTTTITDTYFGTQTINIDGGKAIRSVTFDNTVGWSVSGSQLTVRSIISSGAGTNTMNSVKSYGGENTSWTISAGNAIHINTLYVDNTRNLTLKGGGTVFIDSEVGGWSSSKSITVSDSTLQVDGNSVFAGSGTTYLSSEFSVLQLITSAANLESMVGTTIINNTGFSLSATDIGGGWAQLAVVPEPSMYAAFFGLAVLGFVAYRRRK